MRPGRAPRLIAGALAMAALVAGALASAAPEANRTGMPDRDASRPMLALVIDDLGWAAAAGDRVLELPAPITVAVLPGTPSASRLADAAARRGHEIILHQPMEALDARWPGPGALDTRQPPEELRRRLARNLEAIPHLVGVSNHMGSRLTAQARAMEVVLDEIAERDLYFLDSLTTPDSVAFRTARARSVPSTRRDVFLDHVIRPDLIDRALSDALRLAERRGHAVVIGHPHAVTLEILEARMQEIRERVELVPVSRLIGLDPGVEGRSGSAPVTAR